MYDIKDDINWLMEIAYEEAILAYDENEVPVGCVIVNDNGNIIAQSHNTKEQRSNPCGHAEILSLEKAGKKIGNWRLLNCSVITTLEPCLMCVNALVQARILNLFFGAYDFKTGAFSLGYNFHQNSLLNHKFNVTGGIEHYKNSCLISDFFKQKRVNHKNYCKKL